MNSLRSKRIKANYFLFRFSVVRKSVTKYFGNLLCFRVTVGPREKET